MYTQNSYKENNMISKTKSYNIPIRSLLERMAKGSILSYCTLNELQTQTQQIHHNYHYGKRDSWNALKKATTITTKGYQKKELNLHFHQYCTCEFIEEKICNIIARLTYLGLVNHGHDFIYFPRYALISTYSHLQ